MTYEGASILITGGSGYLGRHFIRHLAERHQPGRVAMFSRDTHKQDDLLRDMHYPPLRGLVGDIRDLSRLRQAMAGVDYVIHAAAIKNVGTAEYNVEETIKTNVLGTINVCRAAIGAGVKRLVFISSDKAVDPANTYGGTKFVGERLVLRENFVKPIFTVVRYGNVVGSTGSVLPYYRSLLAGKAKELPVTDRKMSRFWVTPADACFLIGKAFDAQPGEVVVGKHPSFYVHHLARALHGRVQIKEVGIRIGEKLAEVLIPESEVPRTYDEGRYYRVIPEVSYDDAIKYKKGKPIAPRLPYRTDWNKEWIKVMEIRKLLEETKP